VQHNPEVFDAMPIGKITTCRKEIICMVDNFHRIVTATQKATTLQHRMSAEVGRKDV